MNDEKENLSAEEYNEKLEIKSMILKKVDKQLYSETKISNKQLIKEIVREVARKYDL